MQLLVQFEKNGKFTVGMVVNGKAMKRTINKKQAMTYKVNKLNVTVLENGKPDGGLIFSSATPKKGDKVFLTDKKAGEKEFTLKIISVEKAGPLKEMPPGGPFGGAGDKPGIPAKAKENPRPKK